MPRLGKMMPWCVLGLVAAYLLAGCGGSSLKATAASTASTTRVTATSTSKPPSGPELLYCTEVANSVTPRSELEVLTYEAEQVSARSIATFATACGEGTNIYSYSPDLSKRAITSSEGAQDGSIMAGYLPAGGGSFVNLSGHEGDEYGNTPVRDAQPFIDPKTNELWWIREESQVWSAPLNEGEAHAHGQSPDYGNGADTSFNAAGEPIPLPLTTTPDGSLAAAYSRDKLAVGPPRAFTAACLDRAFAAGGEYYDFEQSPCPGVNEVTYANAASCASFVGFVSDRSLICATGSESAGYAMTLLSLSLSGSQAVASPRLTVAPPTHQTIQSAEVSPDGKDLWFIGIHHPLENNVESNLYVLPTTTATQRPMPVTLIPESLLTSNGQVVGWRWHGQTLPALVP